MPITFIFTTATGQRPPFHLDPCAPVNSEENVPICLKSTTGQLEEIIQYTNRRFETYESEKGKGDSSYLFTRVPHTCNCCD